jgi:hypothetical protein
MIGLRSRGSDRMRRERNVKVGLRRKAMMVVAAAMVSWPFVASGQATPTPEDLNRYFLFNLQGVSFESAKADYLYCSEQIRGILTYDDIVFRDYHSNQITQTGLLGALLVELISNGERRRVHNSAMRRCMALFGYHRYRVPEAEWRALVSGGDIVRAGAEAADSAVVDRLAQFASGPVPNGPELDP